MRGVYAWLLVVLSIGWPTTGPVRFSAALAADVQGAVDRSPVDLAISPDDAWLVTANRSSGARVLRFEVHGRGIGAYIDMPQSAHIWADNASEPVVITGAPLVGSADESQVTGAAVGCSLPWPDRRAP